MKVYPMSLGFARSLVCKNDENERKIEAEHLQK